MKYLLLGAGLQGTAIAHDLLHHCADTTGLFIVDRDEAALTALVERLQDPRVTGRAGDVRDEELLGPVMDGCVVTISAVNYWFNADLAGMAVRHGCHFLDLGGNNDIVAREFELDEAAVAAGVTIVPDCGLAPGLAGILGYWLADGLDQVDAVRLRVGGLPTTPLPPMNYKVVFAVQGLINEYIEPAVVIRGGKLQTVPSLSELEHLTFPAPYGELEAFQTSGGTSTLPQSLLGRVPELDYKTIRYKGHCAQVRLLQELGLTSSQPLAVGGVEVAPRQVLAAVMQQALDLPGQDVVLVLCTAVGTVGETPVSRSIRIIDHADHEHEISAMMRMTGYPTAIIAHLLATGEITAPGARRQELIIPGDRMVAALRSRGVDVVETQSEPATPP